MRFMSLVLEKAESEFWKSVCCPTMFLTVLLVTATCSCQRRHTGVGSAQQTINKRLSEERQTMSGQERWDSLRRDEYQHDAHIEQDPERMALERRRRQLMDDLLTAGPLNLTDCMVMALEFNDRICERRAQIQQVRGEEIVARSRWLPQLVYVLDQQGIKRRRVRIEVEPEEVRLPALPDRSPKSLPSPVPAPKALSLVDENITSLIAGAQQETRYKYQDMPWRWSTDQALLYTQTLLEFGKDNPADVAVRESGRQALFAYEDTVRSVLADVRLTFFTILLRQRQLSERYKLLEGFQQRYEQVRRLEETRRVVEIDVLTARLNVLNEQSRINALEQEILRLKIDLARLAGFPPGILDYELHGEPEDFRLDAESAVNIAIRRSTRIAEARAAVWEQERVAREVLYEYAPELSVRAGWKDDMTSAGLDLSTNNHTYGISSFAERQLDGAPARGFQTPNRLLGTDEEGWFAGAFAEWTLFDGLKRHGRFVQEKARLDQAVHRLRDTVYSVENDVRKAYQNLQERLRDLAIQRETVQISWERLRVNERLKELGQISESDLETFRTQFFRDQDNFFRQQISVVEAQEALRSQMRYFEPFPVANEGEGKSDAPTPAAGDTPATVLP